MRIRSAAIVSLLGFSSLTLAQERDTPDPVLVVLQARLQDGLKDLNPSPNFEVPRSYNGKSLIMRYRTRDYLVYAQTKSGKINREPDKREGPDDEGIFLRINIEPKGQINQVSVPQTLNEKYWSTYLNQLATDDDDKQIYFGLSYRGNTDKELINRIGKILGQRWSIVTEKKGPTPQPELIELSGKFMRPVKWSPQLELFPAGQVPRIDLAGKLIEKFQGGEFLRVKGVMRSWLHRGGTETNPSPFPPQWQLSLEVTEVEVLDDPRDVLRQEPPQQKSAPAQKP